MIHINSSGFVFALFRCRFRPFQCTQHSAINMLCSRQHAAYVRVMSLTLQSFILPGLRRLAGKHVQFDNFCSVDNTIQTFNECANAVISSVESNHRFMCGKLFLENQALAHGSAACLRTAAALRKF